MLACDICSEWFHYYCLGLIGGENKANSLEFTCPFCLLVDRGDKSEEIRNQIIEKQQQYFEYDIQWLLVLFYHY